MSNIIKSFRLIEAEPVNPINSTSTSNTNGINEIIDAKITEAEEKSEKIIEEARIKSSEILEKAEKKYEEMINSAYDRAREILAQAKEDGYKEGYDQGFIQGNEVGYKEGYDQGYNEGKEKSNSLIQESLEIKNSYLEKRNSLLKEVEKDIIELVISIYEKVINKKTEEDDELILSLVLNGIKNLDITNKLTIIASKEDFDILEMAKDKILAKASLISELEIKYDMSFKKGDCILETSKGSIDVSLTNQLEEVKELLTSILNNE